MVVREDSVSTYPVYARVSMSVQGALESYIEDTHPTEDLSHPLADQRAFTRFKIENGITTDIVDCSDRYTGRLEDISLNSLWIATDKPLRKETTVNVTLTNPKIGSMTFSAVVERSSYGGMGLRLETSDSSWTFRANFIEIVRDVVSDENLQVFIEVIDSYHLTFNLEPLWKAWTKAENNLEEDLLQQRFIQTCLHQGKLEFALERYRALHLKWPDCPQASIYLDQIADMIVKLAKPNNTEYSGNYYIFKTTVISSVFLLAICLLVTIYTYHYLIKT